LWLLAKQIAGKGTASARRNAFGIETGRDWTGV
jgi:hypothetical protein